MIVHLRSDGPPELADADRLDRLHADATGPISEMRFGELCARGDDDDHVWLDIAAVRAAGSAQVDDPGYLERFDGMIAYARSKGWVDAAGTRVRAHVEPVTGR